MATAEVQRLLVVIGMRDGLSGPLGRMNRSLGRTDSAVQNLQRNLSRGLAIGAAVATGAIVASIRAAIDYEDAFAGVRKTVQATDAELEKLSDEFRTMATEIPIAATELARLGEAAGALGVPTGDIKEFVRVTALLGVTTNLTADEAADSLGRIGNVLHLTTAEYERFGSALVALGNAGASTEREIIQIAERAGAAGELIGLSTEQVLAFASAVASLGIEPEAGGSSLQKFFIDTTKQVAAGGEKLKILAQVAGQTGDAFRQAFEKDAGGALQDFLAGLGELAQAEQLAVLEALDFKDIRITRALLGLANNTKLVTDQQRVAADAFRENTALSTEAGKRFETLASQLRLLRNNFVELAITFGEGVTPKLRELTVRFTEFLKTNRGDIEDLGRKFGQLLTEVFSEENIAGARAFAREVLPTLADGFRLAGQGVKFAIDIWKQLPPDLQKLLVGALVINKLTGGLVGDVVSGAIRGIGRGILGINAAVVNVNGGIVNGGLPGAGSRVGGAVRTAVGAAATATVILAPVAIGEALKPIITDAMGIPSLDAVLERSRQENTSGLARLADKLQGSIEKQASIDSRLVGINAGIKTLSEGRSPLLKSMLAPILAWQNTRMLGGLQGPAEGGNVARGLLGKLGGLKVTDPNAVAIALEISGHLREVSTNIKTLEGTETRLTDLQNAAIAAGNTTLANRLGTEIANVRAAIAGLPAPVVNVSVPVNISVRQLATSLDFAKTYHMAGTY